MMRRIPVYERVKRVLFGAPRDLFDPKIFHNVSLIAFFAWVYVRIVRRAGYSGWWVLMARGKQRLCVCWRDCWTSAKGTRLCLDSI